MGKVSYVMFPLWRPFVFVIFGVMCIAGIFLLLTPNTSHHGPGVLFGVVWFTILLWNGYWFLFRISYRIELEGDRVRWFTAFRHGEFAIDDLTSIGAPPLMYQLSIFKRRSGPSVITMVQGGLTEFVSEVHRQAPGIAVATGLFERVVRFSWWNGFRRSG